MSNFTKQFSSLEELSAIKPREKRPRVSKVSDFSEGYNGNKEKILKVTKAVGIKHTAFSKCYVMIFGKKLYCSSKEEFLNYLREGFEVFND